MLGILSDFFIRRKNRIGAVPKYSYEIIVLFSTLQAKIWLRAQARCIAPA